MKYVKPLGGVAATLLAGDIAVEIVGGTGIMSSLARVAGSFGGFLLAQRFGLFPR